MNESPNERYKKLMAQSKSKLDKLVLGKGARECRQCKNLFVPRSNGGKKIFCSHVCANRYTWANRPASLPKEPEFKICIQCEAQFQRPRKYSNTQWKMKQFCSNGCANKAKQINDGMTKAERHRRRMGRTVMGSAEWLEKIKTTTKEGMANIDVREKLSKPRAPLSEEAIRRRASKLVGRMPKNLNYEVGSGSYANVKRGDYECSKGTVYFRSRWEANYALYLDFLVKIGDINKWEYEADVFIFEEIKFGNRSYRPDFKVFNNDGSIEYHEVKGHMNGASKTKLRRMDKYYSHVKIILISQPQYTEIYKKFKTILHLY